MRLSPLLLLLVIAGAARAAEPKCGDELGVARSSLAADQRAESPSKARILKARAAWAQVAPECRRAAWYVTAATLLRHPGPPHEPLVAGDVRFATPKEALEAGLRADGKDPELLAYVAYLARVHPEQAPALPEDACATLAGADAAPRDYVCGVQAFTAARWAEALSRLGAVKSPRFPAVKELLATAAARLRKMKLPATEPPRLGCDPFCPLELWRADAQR